MRDVIPTPSGAAGAARPLPPKRLRSRGPSRSLPKLAVILCVAASLISLAGCSSPDPRQACSNIPADKQKIVSDMLGGSNNADDDATEGMNDAIDCADSLTGDARDRRLIDAASFTLQGAVHGDDLFGMRKTFLNDSKNFLEEALSDPDISERNRGEAEDMLETVNEKLGT